MPKLKDAAMLARCAYDPDKHPKPSGWKEILRSTAFDFGTTTVPSGYFGVAYVNEILKEIVISHRGTELKPKVEKNIFDSTFVPSSNITEDLQIATNEVPENFKLAQKLTLKAITLHTSAYQVVQLGHSLGGALAHIVGYKNKQNIIAFDPPGVMTILKKTYGNQLDTQPFLKHKSYVLANNYINLHDEIPGKVYTLNSDVEYNNIDDAATSFGGTTATKLSHSIVNFVNAIPENVADPFVKQLECCSERKKQSDASDESASILCGLL